MSLIHPVAVNNKPYWPYRRVNSLGLSNVGIPACFPTFFFFQEKQLSEFSVCHPETTKAFQLVSLFNRRNELTVLPKNLFFFWTGQAENKRNRIVFLKIHQFTWNLISGNVKRFSVHQLRYSSCFTFGLWEQREYLINSN